MAGSMNYKDYPVGLLKDIEATFKLLRGVVDDNSNLIRITYDNDFRLVIKDLDLTSNYSFTIDSPILTKENRINYRLTFAPTNRLVMETKKLVATSADNQVINNFKNWVAILKIYQTVDIHPTNKVLRDYQEKFYSSFKFLDDEADDKPLPFKYQKQISELLILMIGEFEKDDEIGKEIIEEIIELNKCIPQLTQGQIKGAVSWVLAKLIYNGKGVVNRIAKNATNAGIGQAFIEGIKLIMLG
jgi:hypothetical protein